MEKPNRFTPMLVPMLLMLLVFAAFALLIFYDHNPKRTEHTLYPPIELLSPDLPTIIVDPPQPIAEMIDLIEQEAQDFVDALVPSTPNQQVIVETDKSAFARQESVIELPSVETRTTHIDALMADSRLKPSTKLTLEYLERQETLTTLEAFAAEHPQSHETITAITESGHTHTAPLDYLLESGAIDPEEPITVVEMVTQKRELTVSELNRSNIPANQRVEATIEHGRNRFRIQDVIDADAIEPGSLFYVHRVTERDRQGLWGIIQNGLIERFREGLKIDAIDAQQPVRVTIPYGADQILPSGLSSFLGRVLYGKVNQSYIYNYITQTMGHNPNLIYPGQEVVLIQFSSQELKDIYLFFAEQRHELERQQHTKTTPLPG